MTKSYEFNWQKHLPEFMQEGASFDRFDEVTRSKMLEREKKMRSHPEAWRSGRVGGCGCETARPDANSSSHFHVAALDGDRPSVTSCVGLLSQVVFSIPSLPFTLNDRSQSPVSVATHTSTQPSCCSCGQMASISLVRKLQRGSHLSAS